MSAVRAVIELVGRTSANLPAPDSRAAQNRAAALSTTSDEYWVTHTTTSYLLPRRGGHGLLLSHQHQSDTR